MEKNERKKRWRTRGKEQTARAGSGRNKGRRGKSKEELGLQELL